MTTQKQTISRRRSGNTAAAQKVSAARRQCSACGRKSALAFHTDELMYGTACRYCGDEKMTMKEFE